MPSCSTLGPDAHAIYRTLSDNTRLSTGVVRKSRSNLPVLCGVEPTTFRYIWDELEELGFVAERLNQYDIPDGGVLLKSAPCRCKLDTAMESEYSHACPHMTVGTFEVLTTNSLPLEKENLDLRRTSSSGRAARPAKRWQTNPRNGSDFARYLASCVFRYRRWGDNLGPEPVNKKIMAIRFKAWLDEGIEVPVIKRMIEIFVKDPGTRPTDVEVWKWFLRRKQVLFAQALAELGAEKVAERSIPKTNPYIEDLLRKGAELEATAEAES